MPLLTHRYRRTARLGLALGLAACGGKPTPQLPPPNVTIVTTALKDIPASIKLVGQGAASKFIEVRSQLNGVIVERPYTEGHDVDKGAVLFRLDNAQRTLKRPTPLLAEGEVSRKDVDDATTELQQAQALQLASGVRLHKALGGPWSELGTARE